MKWIITALLLFFPFFGYAQTESDAVTPASYEFHRARVTAILEDGVNEQGDSVQRMNAEIVSKEDEGSVISLEYYGGQQSSGQRFQLGDVLVVSEVSNAAETRYFIVDRYRLPQLGVLLGLFVVLACVFAGRRGAMSFVGLAFTILVITLYVVPRIVDGGNPFVVSLIGTVAIACVSLYLSHGFNRRTSIALVSTLLTIVVALGISSVFVSVARLFGLGSEEAYYLQSLLPGAINLRGLLLGAMLIGVLGVLDDITTAQTAAIDELRKANPTFGFGELFRRGYSIGKEHIASLINTLALAYVGASLPLLLLFTLNAQPIWMTLNSELIAEEIVRTLVGSTTLVIAVPLTTALAAYVYSKRWFSRTPESHS